MARPVTPERTPAPTSAVRGVPNSAATIPTHRHTFNTSRSAPMLALSADTASATHTNAHVVTGAHADDREQRVAEASERAAQAEGNACASPLFTKLDLSPDAQPVNLVSHQDAFGYRVVTVGDLPNAGR